MTLKMPFRWLAVILAALATAPAQAGDSVILTADHWCPHTCDPQSGHAGYMIDIAREALALAGLKTIYQLRPWATGLNEVRSGLADGIVGILPTEAPDLPRNHLALGRQANAIAVRADDTFSLDGLGSLAGRQIATVKDYSYSAAIDSWLLDHAPQVSAQSGDHAAEGNLDRLLNQSVDTVLDDEAVLRETIIRTAKSTKVRIAGHLSGGSLHIAFSPARQRGKALADILDDGIARLRQTGRLAEILASYGLADWE
ncbi:substrate-binding periplasmic protein [Magnetospirillum sulfuroxidans]|uniref:Transporter substrate-binding domain-containing protein n=1 Tax=Magnetospirillum sulfuroxidans TaxID=611300 RepID=A0ABS5IFV3_9PROT|nr:transporter substrate-binding domain-containing protein [Magnetospirillum sulfuroxidans]MBR9973062.1 transporter substrate-binding domain-containing protein [Magnetospirillum sulfuroxidans]